MIYIVFKYIWEITPKINCLSVDKLQNMFMATLNDCKIPDEKRVRYFYKYICKNLCGIKKNFKDIKIRELIQDLIGFDRTGEYYEF